jgi:hypothetical protein
MSRFGAGIGTCRICTRDSVSRMADIHCHILPEVDDGPKSWETTLEMCNLADSVANKSALVEHNPRAVVARSGPCLISLS